MVLVGVFLLRVLLILLISGFLSSDILQGNFKPDFYLKYIQKDLRLAIALGDAVNHPTPMAAAANEVTKEPVAQVPAAFPLFLLLFLLSTYFCFSLVSGLISQDEMLGH